MTSWSIRIGPICLCGIWERWSARRSNGIRRHIRLPFAGRKSSDAPETPDISDTIDTTGYGTLPQSIETLDYRITATVLMGKDDSEGARLYLSLKNKSDTVLRFDQGSTVFTIDGKDYDYRDIDSLYYDNRWYTTYLEKDQETEGYLRLPKRGSGRLLCYHHNQPDAGRKE